MMMANNSVQDVARFLKRGGFASIFATMLEAAQPLRVLGAQAAFIFDPLLGGDSGALTLFGEVLEDPEAFANLIDVLRNEASE